MANFASGKAPYCALTAGATSSPPGRQARPPPAGAGGHASPPVRRDAVQGKGAGQLPDGYAIDVWRDKLNLQNDYHQDREFQRTRNMSGIPAQRTQDTAMVERQGDGPIVDRSLEKLSATDAPLIKMRALLIDAARDLQRGVEPFNASHPESFSTVAIECISQHTELDGALRDVEALLGSHSRPWKVGIPATVGAG